MLAYESSATKSVPVTIRNLITSSIDALTRNFDLHGQPFEHCRVGALELDLGARDYSVIALL
jgi:hypothetical protein